MTENLARETANQIVDKIVSTEPIKLENAYDLLARNLYKEAYPGEPVSHAGNKFVAEVFTDINGQYTNAKSVPENLAMAWASKQAGHELPATGFNQDDLQKVLSSTDANVTTLDKYMAGVLNDNYSQLQKDSEIAAGDRIIRAHFCEERHKIADDYRKQSGIPAGTPLGGILSESNCTDKEEPGDRVRNAGVIREIPITDIEDRLKNLDAAAPTRLWF